MESKGLQVGAIIFSALAIYIRFIISEEKLIILSSTINCLAILVALMTITIQVSYKLRKLSLTSILYEKDRLPKSVNVFRMITWLIVLPLGLIVTIILVINNLITSFGNDILSIISVTLAITTDLLSDILAFFFCPRGVNSRKANNYTLTS